MKELKTFKGSCDASGVVHLDAEHFASGTDEANRISIHPRSGNGEPTNILDLNEFLGAEFNKKNQKHAECDIESATRLGDLTFWITSHGRNKKGELAPDRHRLFALEIIGSGQELRLEPFGQPYRNLLEDLLSADFPKDWLLADASTKAPQQEGGLNIEAICATPEGGVWVGFRNPVPQEHAILVELLNPLELISVAGAHAQFGNFESLDLGGRGIRDMNSCKGGYLILAGSYDDKQSFALFHWQGIGKPATKLPLDPADGAIYPEGLIIFPGDSTLLNVFSDDDAVLVGGVMNKELPIEKQTFRVVSAILPQATA